MSDEQNLNKEMNVSQQEAIPQEDLVNPISQVYFRAGLLAARESLARFVECESPTIAASIRANWWPSLGPDPGPPRLLDFNDMVSGGDEGPWVVREDFGPSTEALPIALGFLNTRDLTARTDAED